MGGDAIYKVYDEDDVFLGVLDDVISDLVVPMAINSTGMAIDITLARNADSQSFETQPYLDSDGDTYEDSGGFTYDSVTTAKNKIGPGSLINLNYRVDIVTSVPEDLPYLDSDGDAYNDSADEDYISIAGGSGGVKFTGFISNISINYGGDENTVITVTSYGFDLDQYLIESGGDTTVTFTAEKASDVMKGVIDLYQTSAGAGYKITYDGSTIDDSGDSVNHEFNTNTTKEGVQTAFELGPADWFYYLDPGSNLLYYKQRPTGVAHYFYLGKHIETLDVDSSILSATNDVPFSGGENPLSPGNNVYVREQQTPAANTRRVLMRQSNDRVKTVAEANIIAAGTVERNNVILYTTKITVLAATYDINSVKVGDLVGFRNFDNYVDGLELQITKLDFMLDKINLELGTMLPSFNKRLEDVNRSLALQETANNPVAPS